MLAGTSLWGPASLPPPNHHPLCSLTSRVPRLPGVRLGVPVSPAASSPLAAFLLARALGRLLDGKSTLQRSGRDCYSCIIAVMLRTRNIHMRPLGFWTK